MSGSGVDQLERVAQECDRFTAALRDSEADRVILGSILLDLQAATKAALGIGTDLLTPGEVGKMLRVDPKTVVRWASQGRLSAVRTPGGHRRFRRSDIDAILLDRQAPR